MDVILDVDLHHEQQRQLYLRQNVHKNVYKYYHGACVIAWDTEKKQS